jgi:hypothetical protein
VPGNWQSWSGLLGDLPNTVPYVAAIPQSLVQGDSPTWRDRPYVDQNGTEYDAIGYVLKYVIGGPIAAPLELIATADGNAWVTTITTDQSAALAPGLFWWQAMVLTSGVRITIAQGELTIVADVSQAGGNYDGRTVAEKALAQAQAALATFKSSQGRISQYVIGSRHMAFQNDAQLLAVIMHWKREVSTERSVARGGRDRHILARFNRVT